MACCAVNALLVTSQDKCNPDIGDEHCRDGNDDVPDEPARACAAALASPPVRDIATAWAFAAAGGGEATVG